MSDNQKADNSRERELDEFWDISSLIPSKKTTAAPPARSIALTEITAGGHEEGETEATSPAAVAADATRLTLTRREAREGSLDPTLPAERKISPPPRTAPPADGERDTVITRFIPPHTPTSTKKEVEPDEEYTLEGSMLHRVRIFRWKTSYQYYEDFCQQATALQTRRGEPCAPVAFFSYVPQYSQMNRAQLAWYLYWRDGVRRGEILTADYSYILLYIYEIINLAEAMDVRFGQQQLCALRRAFGGTYPRLRSLLNEWICDYSLIHRLPPPALEDMSAVADCTLKEFYVPDTDASTRYATALMAFGSNYAYTKSKFAVGENRALYDRHMAGALAACIADRGEVGERMASANLEESRLIRDAYTGALCSHRIKRRIEIDYCSFARSHELRILVTDIMKYTENRLRAYLGVKSRLGLYALPQSFRDCVDRYMRDALPARERTARIEPRQEYDALYDVPKTALSLSRAAEIEANSWNTTERLIAAFEPIAELSELSDRHTEESIPPAPPHNDITSPPSPPSPPSAPPSTVEISAPTAEETDETALLLLEIGELMPFVNAVLCLDVAAQGAFARTRGEMIDSIADRINEIAADILGDIVLEESGDGGYAVIEDYRSVFENKS